MLIGDINIDLLNNENTVEEYKNSLVENGFLSAVNDITRPESKTCIDHIFIKSKNPTDQLHSFIFQSKITDHYPIAIHIPYKNPFYEKNRKELNEFDKTYINKNKLKELVSHETWEGVYKEIDVNTATEKFKKTLQYHIKSATTIKKFNSKKVNKNPWIRPPCLNQ